MKKNRGRTLFFFLIFSLLSSSVLFAGKDDAPPSSKTPERLALVDAAMCENIDSQQPVNRAVVFSVTLGEVICYTAFDPVPKKTAIFHEWYHKDALTSKKKLKLSPPRWSSISRIQLREADKGPWRVEIVDDEGKILRTLRFSITD